MESSDGWTVCSSARKKKRQERIQCPHLIRYEKAHQLQKQLNIANLASTLLSQDVQQLQHDGWIYTRSIKPQDAEPQLHTDRWEYMRYPVANEWGDEILLRRALATEGTT